MQKDTSPRHTKSNESVQPQNPGELVTLVCDRLTEQGILPAKNQKQIVQKILGGGMKLSDWTSLAEAAVKKESEDAQQAAN